MNKYEMRSKNSYDKKAEHYDSTFDGKFTVKFKNVMCETVCINSDNTVVDIACGNGRLLNMLAKKHNFYGYGVDISDKMIEQAKKLNKNMEFYVAGCEELPFENEKVDVMTVCAAYHHFPNVEKFAEEAKRVITERLNSKVEEETKLDSGIYAELENKLEGYAKFKLGNYEFNITPLPGGKYVGHVQVR